MRWPIGYISPGYVRGRVLAQPHVSLAAGDADPLVRRAAGHRRCGLQRWKGLRHQGMEPKGWSHAEPWWLLVSRAKQSFSWDRWKIGCHDLACQIAGSSAILHKKLQAIRYADETDATLLDPFCWISKPMKGHKMKQALEAERNGVVLLNHDCRTLNQWLGLRENIQ